MHLLAAGTGGSGGGAVVVLVTAVVLVASATNALVADAIPRWPGPGYITAPLVSACCFDNFTVQVNYNTTHGTTTQGYRLDMTNWATVHLPIEAAPNDFDVRQVLRGECGQCTVTCGGLT